MDLAAIDINGVVETMAIGIMTIVAFFATVIAIGKTYEVLRRTWWAEEVWRWVVGIIGILFVGACVIAFCLWGLWCIGSVTQWIFS